MKKFFAILALCFSFYSLLATEYNSNIYPFSHLKSDGDIVPASAPKSEPPLSHFISKNIFSLPITQENITAKCVQFLLENNAISAQNNLLLLSAKLRRKQWYVNFIQTHNGLTVLNANTSLQVFENGNLMHIKSIYFPEIAQHSNLQPVDLIDTIAMKQVAISNLSNANFVNDLEFTFGKQCILPITQKGEKTAFRLVQIVEFCNKIGDFSYYCLIDVETNKLLERRNKIYDFDYHFRSKIVEIEPNLPLVETTYFPYIEAKVGDNTYRADSTGKITTNTELNGKQATVSFGELPLLEFISWNGGYSYQNYPFNNICQISNGIIQNNDDILLNRVVATHYHHFDAMKKRFQKIDPGFIYLSYAYIITYVTYDGSPFYLDGADTIWITNERNLVNASSGGDHITFYHPLCSLYQLGQMPSVLYHELGHSITTYVYWGNGGDKQPHIAVHEALADVQAAIMLGYPDVFRGATPDYSPTSVERTLDNTMKLGYDETGEGHNDGQILSGAHWDLSKLTSLDLMAELMYFTRFAHPNWETAGEAFTNYLLAMLTTDDDDGNLYNKTPHWNEITTAFDKHNISLESFLSYQYEHQPIEDTKDTTNPYTLELTFSDAGYSSFVASQINDVWLHYSTNRGIKDSVQMLNSASNQPKFAAEIPPMPIGTIVDYYFKVNSPFRDTAYSFELHPERERYKFLVGFDTLFHDNSSDSANHRFTSENTCSWHETFINNMSTDGVSYRMPLKDRTGEGNIWFCGSAWYLDYERLLTADIYFPTFYNLGNAEGYFISLYYTSWVDALRVPPTSSLVFSISKDGEENWTDVFATHKSANSIISMPWQRLLFNAYDYFNSFDSLTLRVRFNGEQGEYADMLAQISCIDDVNVLTTKDFNSIIEETAIISVQLSPNPAQTEVSLSLDLANSGNLHITLTDLLGKELQEIHNGFETASNFTKTFSINKLPKGVYYVKIVSKGSVAMEKLVVN